MAHDAHNVVVVGVNDADIQFAVEALKRMRGGQVAVADGKVQAEPGFADCGIGFRSALKEVIGKAELKPRAHAMGCSLDAPFMTLSFLSLSPIPELKLTDQGLIDAVILENGFICLEERGIESVPSADKSAEPN